MNFKVLIIFVAFVLAACAASPIEKPQQMEIGKNLIKKILFAQNVNWVHCYFLVKIPRLNNSWHVTCLDPMLFAPFIAWSWNTKVATATSKKSANAVIKCQFNALYFCCMFWKCSISIKYEFFDTISTILSFNKRNEYVLRDRLVDVAIDHLLKIYYISHYIVSKDSLSIWTNFDKYLLKHCREPIKLGQKE